MLMKLLKQLLIRQNILFSCLSYAPVDYSGKAAFNAPFYNEISLLGIKKQAMMIHHFQQLIGLEKFSLHLTPVHFPPLTYDNTLQILLAPAFIRVLSWC